MADQADMAGVALPPPLRRLGSLPVADAYLIRAAEEECERLTHPYRDARVWQRALVLASCADVTREDTAREAGAVASRAVRAAPVDSDAEARAAAAAADRHDLPGAKRAVCRVREMPPCASPVLVADSLTFT